MKKKPFFLKNPIAFTLVVVSLCCLLVIILSTLQIPDVSPADNLKISGDGSTVGAFGDMMLQMLPEDLPFTVFVPSEKAFERDLRLVPSQSLTEEKMSDTIAVVSRVLGFSTVPRTLDSNAVPLGKEASYESISGFELFVSREKVGDLVVNGVRSKRVDLRRGKILVHVMDGVIMDSEFEQSVQPEEE